MSNLKRSGAPVRKRAERTHDQKRIAALYLDRHTITEIAETLNLSRTTVHRDIQALEDAWRKDGLLDMHRAKMRQLMELRRIRNEALHSWEESKKGETEVTEVRPPPPKKGAKPKPIRQTIKRKTSNGDPAYLAAFLRAIEDEADLLGTKIRKLELDATEEAVVAAGGMILLPEPD